MKFNIQMYFAFLQNYFKLNISENITVFLSQCVCVYSLREHLLLPTGHFIFPSSSTVISYELLNLIALSMKRFKSPILPLSFHHCCPTLGLIRAFLSHWPPCLCLSHPLQFIIYIPTYYSTNH